MSKQILIYMPRIHDGRVQWATTDGQGGLSSPVSEGSLSEAAAAVDGLRCTLIVPADDILLTHCVIPGNSYARAQQAAPYALEEQVADDVDDLHFALSQKSKHDSYTVAVIARATMDKLMADCESAELRPSEILPETLVIPHRDSERSLDPALGPDLEGEPKPELWCALLDSSRVVLRLSEFEGFAADLEMAPMMLEGAMAAREEPRAVQLIVYRTDETVSLDLPNQVEAEYHHCESRLALFAVEVDNPARASGKVNLLQGDYSLGNNFDKAWKPWRTTAVLASSVVLVLLLGRYMDVRSLAQQEAALDDQISQAFSQALPGTRMQRPRRQVQSALASIGANSNNGFTSRLAQIAASLSTQPQTELRTIGYRQGRFDLDLETDAVPTLDALASELGKRGSLNLSVQSANRENGKVRGRVRIE